MTEFLFEVAKWAIIFIGGSTSFIFFAMGIKIFILPKDEWTKTREIPVINTKTNCWELIKIPVLPDCFLSQKEKEVYIHFGKRKELFMQVDAQKVENFTCPICDSSDFYECYKTTPFPIIKELREKEIMLYSCSGCSIIFIDPEKFSKIFTKTKEKQKGEN